MSTQPTADAASQTPGHRRITALYAIFFISGFCGLIYESIWSHYLKLLLGHAAYAQAVVLVVFVGGLALGAWLTGRVSERLKHPIMLYAAVEAAVAVIAFLFQRVFEQASAWATSSFLPAMCGEAGPCVASWLLAAALILPASVLLGTTFPLMSAGVIRMGVRPGRGLSLLYFLNSAGAALGVLGAGFVLIPALGLPGTMLLAGGMNLFVAFAAFVTWRLGVMDATQEAAPVAASPRADRAYLRTLLVVAALTGLSSFIYEVVWIRMLTLIFGAATHSFELMLAPFIFGLALGAWWIRGRIDSAHAPLKLLGTIQVVMGVLAVATLPLYASMFDAMAFAMRTLTRTEEGYRLYLLVSAAMACAVMLPATICAGMTLPLITAILMRQGNGEREIGRVYGVNTVGAIAGVLLAVHLLIPWLGLKWALAFGAAVDVALGIVLWRMHAGQPAATAGPGDGAAWGRGLAVAAVAAAATMVVVPLLSPLDNERMSSGVFRHGLAREDAEVRFHRDGKTATVTVIEFPGGARTVKTNGKPDGASHPERKMVTNDDPTVVLLGALGPMHHPQARKAAVIGLGTGITTAVLLESKTLQSVDTIEIEPAMVAAAELFRPRNAAAFDDPRSRIVLDDARAHFSKARTRYDIVVSEPSNPWVSGVAGLFTVEFYRHVAAHLANDGHFVQWLHLYETSPQVVGSIVRAFETVFPGFIAYSSNSNDVLLVARRDGQVPKLVRSQYEASPGLAARLQDVGITSVDLLEAHSSGPNGPIRMLARSYGAPPNSDFFPFVDNRAAADRFRRAPKPTMFSVPETPVPFLEFITGPPAYAGRVTNSVPTMPYNVTSLAAGLQLYRALQGETLAPQERELIRPMALDLAAVQAWMAACKTPAADSPAWNAVLRVAGFVNPAVTPEQATRLWKGFSGRCGKQMSAAQRDWFELFATVGARDAAATARVGRDVLAAGELSLDSRAYATLATVGALVALSDRAGAAAMLQDQRRQLTAPIMELPWFRFLVLLLSSPARPAQP
jgi:spermidine synthase